MESFFDENKTSEKKGKMFLIKVDDIMLMEHTEDKSEYRITVKKEDIFLW